MTQYISQADADYWNKLYSEPPAIVAACNKVVREQSRSMHKEWWHGIATGVAVVMVAVAAVIWMLA